MGEGDFKQKKLETDQCSHLGDLPKIFFGRPIILYLDPINCIGAKCQTNHN
jgi:hypothetical protein